MEYLCNALLTLFRNPMLSPRVASLRRLVVVGVPEVSRSRYVILVLSITFIWLSWQPRYLERVV